MRNRSETSSGGQVRSFPRPESGLRKAVWAVSESTTWVPQRGGALGGGSCGHTQLGTETEVCPLHLPPASLPCRILLPGQAPLWVTKGFLCYGLLEQVHQAGHSKLRVPAKTFVRALRFPAALRGGCCPGNCAPGFELQLMRPDANCWLPGLKPCSPSDLLGSCPAPRRQAQPHPLAQSLQNGIPGCRESEDSDYSGWRGAPSSHSPRDPGWGWPPSCHWPSAGLTRDQDQRFH